MEAKNSFSMVLLIIIAALAIALCGLTGYIFLSNGSTKTVERVVEEPKRPADSEVTIKKLFDKKIMNLKVSENNKAPVIQMSAEMVHLKKVKGIKSVEEKLKNYEGEIKEIIITYFQGLTIEDVKKQDAKETAKKEITKKINELLCSNEESKATIVYTINFEEWFYQ